MISAKKLGSVLVKEHVITEEQMLKAFDYQNMHGGSLKDAVMKLRLATEDDVIGAIVSNLGISYMGLASYEAAPEALEAVPADYCWKNKLVPVSLAGSTLTVAMSDPLDAVVLDQLRLSTGFNVVPAIAREKEVFDALKKHYAEAREEGRGARQEEDLATTVAREYSVVEQVDMPQSVDEHSAPIIRLASRIVEDAHGHRASDVHVEPYEDETVVRIRVDGVLQVHMRLPLAAVRPLVSRFKIMSGLDIAEHRLPQDGRIRFKDFSRSGLDVDLRVSTLPVSFGEKVVMRLLDKKSTVIGLDAMGFSKNNLDAYRRAISQPYGMVLNVGPTGSGKTTTLYAALTEINKPEINIQTAEDPVEYMLKGINQTQMNRDIGLTFASALRSFLRQDPDVIMVGEIRDLETATIGIEAALTGHLLFSTLHTNDAVGTVVRLVEMGIEPFLVSSSLLLVCAQRLMRRLCTCRQPDAPDAGEAKSFKRAGVKPDGLKIYRPRGCDACSGTGYRGRIGTHETLAMSKELHELVNAKSSDEQLRKAAVKGGMVPIFSDALVKVASGVTSFEEAVRVVRER